MIPILIAAGNPSEWTGPTGNNTWLLPGAEPALIDAGVGRPEHLDAIARALAGTPLVRLLLTHGHPDHAGGVPALRERWPGLTVVPASGAATLPQSVRAGDGELEVIPTPGHAPEHLCFFDPVSRDLYSGDLLRLGGTVVVPASKGGDMRAYLASLTRVRELAPRRLLPGHGPIVGDPIALIDEYLAHRADRERQIVDALREGARTPEEIVSRIYPGLSSSLRAAAADTVQAHLEKLRSEEPCPNTTVLDSAP